MKEIQIFQTQDLGGICLAGAQRDLFSGDDCFSGTHTSIMTDFGHLFMGCLLVWVYGKQEKYKSSK